MKFKRITILIILIKTIQNNTFKFHQQYSLKLKQDNYTYKYNENVKWDI